MDALLDDCIRELQAVIRPRTCTAFFSVTAVENGIWIPDAGVRFEGGDIARHLHGCDRCALMAVTLGVQADALIRRYAPVDMTRSLVLDAAASGLTEALCGECENELRAKARTAGQCLTGRFSPGYGDMPLESQEPLLRLLDAGRRIGLYLSESCLMTPSKSVTAVLGLYDGEEREENTPGCAACDRHGRCDFQKGGEFCGHHDPHSK